MGIAFFRDDNAAPLVDPCGLRPGFGASNIVSTTLTASTQAIALPVGAPTNGKNPSGERMLRVSGDAQGVLFALDIAGQSASYTGPANMVRLNGATMWMDVKVGINDTFIYVLQLGTAGLFQAVLMQ